MNEQVRAVQSEQAATLKEVNKLVKEGIKNTKLSVKSIKRVLTAHLEPDNKEVVSKLSDEEMIMFTLLGTQREELIKTLALNHAIENLKE